MSSTFNVPFNVICNSLGEVCIQHEVDDIEPFQQVTHILPWNSSDAQDWLEQEHLSCSLIGAVADVNNAGLSWRTTYIAPRIWTDPLPPVAAVETLLPPLNSDGRTAEYRQIFLDTPEGEASGLAALLQKQHAAQNSREFVRGDMGSVPFAPGGEDLVAVDTTAIRAAREANSGVWLSDYESGRQHLVPPPGLSRGLFGAWSDDTEGQITLTEAEPLPGEHPNHQRQPRIKAMPETRARGDEELIAASEHLLADVWLPEDATSAAPQVPPVIQHIVPSSISALGRLNELPEELLIEGRTDLAASQAAAEVELLLSSTSMASATRFAPAANSGGGIAAPTRQQGDTEWAATSHTPDLERTWTALKPHLAHRFPFELDTFQKEAIIHLEKGDSVFVAAHTSAGKTVVAEYAFALATRHCTRAVYTSPIKTISNQKFRDFGGTFDVGLLTGDISMKPEAACLIMTTEILRSMLYKGADVIRDIEWVIFDEVHYVNDAERGVVWEEVIIMLPEHVNLVLLSATVPNVMEFADWVGRTKRKKLWVTGTTRRPVPLEHVLYYDTQFYTINQNNTMVPNALTKAKLAYKKRNAVPVTKKDAKDQRPTGRGGFGMGRGREAPSGRGGRGAAQRAAPRGPTSMAKATNSLVQRGSGANATSGSATERTQWLLLIKALKLKEQLPMVVFCFSKKRCDSLVDGLGSLDFTSSEDKSEIQVFCTRALARLRSEDRGLPQIKRLLSLLKRGLGIHHAGLLPIMKEVVEMLFCRGLLKVLFCTETFAMGVNAPARTVVFQSIRKHDGKGFRNLLPGEYTQMAGRAGRRGLDPVGTVIIACWDTVPEEADLRTLLTGRATQLLSKFRLTYTMILNLLRVEDLQVEDMLKRSFLEVHTQKAAPQAARALARGQSALAALRARQWSVEAVTRDDVSRYVQLNSRIQLCAAELQAVVMATRGAQQALQPGRVVIVSDPATSLPQLAVLLSKPTAATNKSTGSPADSASFQVAALRRRHPQEVEPAAAHLLGHNSLAAYRKPSFNAVLLAPLPRYGGGEGSGSSSGVPTPHWVVRQADTSQIQAIGRAKVQGDWVAALGVGEAADEAAAELAVGLQHLQAAAEARREEVDWLHPLTDLKVNQMKHVDTCKLQQQLITERAALTVHWDRGIGEAHAVVHSEALLAARLKALAHSLSDANLSGMPEFQQRVGVLRAMNYISLDDTVAVKGRVACEINSGDELVATEIIFAGVLAGLTPPEAVALLSALVFQERTDAVPSPGMLPPALEQAAASAKQLALEAGVLQQAAGLPLIPADFAKEALNFGLMEVVFEWASGTPFVDICQLTDVMEGSIVRTVVRLDETCREFRDAARVMGDTALWAQMDAASAAIKRDVVFAASLYVV